MSPFIRNNSLTDCIFHATLTPSPQMLGALTKEACKLWEDHLWVCVSALCVSEDMRLSANFWEQGMKAFDMPSFAKGKDLEGEKDAGQNEQAKCQIMVSILVCFWR